MNIEDFEKLKNITKTKMVLTNENIVDKSISIISYYHQYLNLYIDEYKLYKDLLVEKEKLYGVLYNDLRYNTNKDLKSRTEIEPFINSNDMYYKLCLRINDQEMIVKYLEEVMDSIKKLSFNIKNIIDLKNLQGG